MYPKSKHMLILVIAFALFIPVFSQHFAGQTAAVKASALFDSPLPNPANDPFAAAEVIPALAFSDSTDLTYATLEAGEPVPSCNWGFFNKSIWYTYTPTTSGSLLARIEGGNGLVAIYSGTTLNTLSPIQCTYNWNQVSFQAQAGVQYYFQVGSLFDSNTFVNFSLKVTPPPQVSFYYSPGDPSSFDNVWFNDNSYDPGNVGFQSGTWNFGDGSSSADYYTSHQFAADGDYTVAHTVTTGDGRTGSTSQVVQVRTRDIYITKMARPNSATVGQTKRLIVSVAAKRYPQTVRVDLYKSVIGGFQQVGYLEQLVAANRTVDFYFSHTFTAADAQVGKVTFKAIANLVGGRDAFPADNEFITLPVAVSARNGRSAEAAEAVDDLSQYAIDEESNKAADGPTIGQPGEAAVHHLYVPMIKQ